MKPTDYKPSDWACGAVILALYVWLAVACWANLLGAM